jgi:intraflagellar transport protein 52
MQPLFVFDACKSETFLPDAQYSAFKHSLAANIQVFVRRPPSSAHILPPSLFNSPPSHHSNKHDIYRYLDNARLFIFGDPHEPFTDDEIDALIRYRKSGGSILFCLSAATPPDVLMSVNALFEATGIQGLAEGVVNTKYMKQKHPADAVLHNPLLNRAMVPAVGQDATLLFPRGCALAVEKPGVPIISSGPLCFPLNAPVVAVADDRSTAIGRLALVGSAAMFANQCFAHNKAFIDTLVRWLARDPDCIVLDAVDADEPDVSDAVPIPAVAATAPFLRAAIHRPERLPGDFTSALDSRIFSIGTGLVPAAAALYKQCNVPQTPLTVVAPDFTSVLPRMQAATHPPALLPPPGAPRLELFDLDAEFASEDHRLATLATRCSPDKPEDVEFFIRRAGDILGISSRLPEGSRGPKDILHHVLQTVVAFRSFERELGGTAGQEQRPASAAAPALTPSMLPEGGQVLTVQ